MNSFRLARKARLPILFFLLFSGAGHAVTLDEANAMLADQQWAEAAAAFQELSSAAPDDATLLYSLGLALIGTGDADGAETALDAALAKGLPGPVRAQYNLARVYMLQDRREDAMTVLEGFAANGGPGHQRILGTAEFASLLETPRFKAVVEALKPCNTAQFRAFDFWLGDWDVTAANAPTANNQITATQGGCVVHENYTAGSFTGISMNFYDATTERWHQTWMSNQGGALYLEGGLNDAGSMVLSDAELPVSALKGVINRITWTPNDDGSVRQLWETSSDKGATWNVGFDGLYVKRTDGS